MYQKAYGIIETLAPLHVGASAGEETGNLNLIFRDQFTQTGIIPGSSIRGRFRADMRGEKSGKILANIWYGHDTEPDEEADVAEQPTESSPVLESKNTIETKDTTNSQSQTKDRTTEALVKFEYASLVWIPVFVPGQSIVWVSCPRLLKRYQLITGNEAEIPKPSGNPKKYPVSLKPHRDRLFFNLGFLDNLEETPDLSEKWVPKAMKSQLINLVVVDDTDISLIHDMALYRQTRTQLKKDIKKVENFFGFEALPEGSILIFPISIKKTIPKAAKEALAKLKQEEKWKPFEADKSKELYFGGLESIGCGRCHVTLVGKDFNTSQTGGNQS